MTTGWIGYRLHCVHIKTYLPTSSSFIMADCNLYIINRIINQNCDINDIEILLTLILAQSWNWGICLLCNFKGSSQNLDAKSTLIKIYLDRHQFVFPVNFYFLSHRGFYLAFLQRTPTYLFEERMILYLLNSSAT